MFPDVTRFQWPALPAGVIALVGALAVFSPPTSTHAAPAVDPSLAERRTAEQQRLQRIRGEIEDLRTRLEGAESRAGSIVDALDEMELRMALFSRERTALRHEEEGALLRIEENQHEAATIEKSLVRSERDLRTWLREAYKAGPMRYMRIIAVSDSPARVAAGQRAIEGLSLVEGRRLDRYRTERTRLDAVLDDLDREQQRLEDLQVRIASKEDEIRRAHTRKEAVLAGIRKEQTSQKKALGELRQVEVEVKELLTRLESTDGDRVPSLGFQRFRGLLGWPAEGSVMIPYGNVRHPKFNTVVPHPGIDIAAVAGLEVRAVFDGRVVFSSWFRGYGPMIVIDHGDGYLSVYGHLGELHVELEQEVRQGAVIGRAGESGPFEKSSLYFEIRHDGNPQDPALWLRPPSTTVAASGGERRTVPSTRAAP